MGMFHTDSVVLSYSDVEAAKRWWVETFGCKAVRIPQDWDNPLPSDVALTLPGCSEPTILLNARSEVEQAHFDRPSPAATAIFCEKLKKAHEHLSSRGVSAGPIQDGGDMQFFEVRDTEGHLIEICKEP
jgi:catechol 2,3-dioxygenase-like lactoylglutathione lyase family enzyme